MTDWVVGVLSAAGFVAFIFGISWFMEFMERRR